MFGLSLCSFQWCPGFGGIGRQHYNGLAEGLRVVGSGEGEGFSIIVVFFLRTVFGTSPSTCM